MSRINYIDKAKGFAICAVVTGHVLVYDLYSFEKAWNISNLTQFIYSFHMSLFIRVCFRYSYKRKCLAWYMETFQDSHYPIFVVGSVYSLTIGKGFGFMGDQMKFGYWYLLDLKVFSHYIPISSLTCVSLLYLHALP